MSVPVNLNLAAPHFETIFVDLHREYGSHTPHYSSQRVSPANKVLKACREQSQVNRFVNCLNKTLTS